MVVIRVQWAKQRAIEFIDTIRGGTIDLAQTLSMSNRVE